MQSLVHYSAAVFYNMRISFINRKSIIEKVIKLQLMGIHFFETQAEWQHSMVDDAKRLEQCVNGAVTAMLLG